MSNDNAEHGIQDMGYGPIPYPASRIPHPASRIPGYGEQLPMLYALDRRNGWSIGMRAITHAIMAHAKIPAGPILELGCGAGVFNAELSQERMGQGAVFGADLHPLALAYARQNLAGARWSVTGGSWSVVSHQPPATSHQPPAPLLQANLHHLPIPDAALSAILALDVFDQQGVRIETALAESRRVLRTGGKLILRVSAYPWLQGAHDAAFNTGRRYYRHELATLLAAQGFQIERMTHANTLLAPPVILLRLLQRAGYGIRDTGSGRIPHPASRILHLLFAQALRLEARWLPLWDLPAGISLYAVATKNDRVMG